jgi:Fur family zinc uptake transcriptional regulator
MPRNPRPPAKLSEKEVLIESALRKAGRPLSAYDLIELLHSDGISSPPTVYRALKRLTEAGRAHRIESLNAFVCCAHGGHSGSAAFAICGDCGMVTEFHQDEVAELLGAWARQQAFNLLKTTIELRGRCHDCAPTNAEGNARHPK